jgi:hypothetical protein
MIILINLINIDVSQSTNVLMRFFWVMSHLVAHHHKHYEISPLPPQYNHIFYIVLHSYVKPYKCIFKTFTLFYMA